MRSIREKTLEVIESVKEGYETVKKGYETGKKLWGNKKELKKLKGTFTKISGEVEEIIPKWKPYSKPTKDVVLGFQNEYEKLAQEDAYKIRCLTAKPSESVVKHMNEQEMLVFVEKDQLCYYIKKNVIVDNHVKEEIIKGSLDEGIDEDKLDKKYFDQFKDCIENNQNLEEQLPEECKSALLDLTSRRGHTPSDPWRLFFNSIKRIFDLSENLAHQYSNGQDISAITTLLSNLMLQGLKLIRAFDN